MGLSAQVFNAIIGNVLEDQIEYLNLQGKDEPDYIVEVFKFLRMEDDCGLVKDGYPKKGFLKSPIYHDSDSGHIFIVSSKMKEMSEEISETLKKTVTVHNLADALIAEGIIMKDNNKGGTRSKKVGNKRCFVLDYNKLEDYVREVAEEYEDEQNCEDASEWIIPRR